MGRGGHEAESKDGGKEWVFRDNNFPSLPKLENVVAKTLKIFMEHRPISTGANRSFSARERERYEANGPRPNQPSLQEIGRPLDRVAPLSALTGFWMRAN